MTQRLSVAFLLASLSFACSGGGSGGGSGGNGNSGGAGPGTGGATPGTGGASTGSGGASPGTGGAAPGTGGAATGTGGSGTAGTAGAGGRANTGGAGGRANTGGAPATGGAAGAAMSTGSVPERNKNPSRDGHFLQPTLTKAAAATMMPDAAFNTAATFTGNVLGTPLFLDGSPGKFFVGTTSNDVVARNENGTQAWAPRNIGAPATGNIGCSGISTGAPLGILSTPSIDVASKTLYAAGIIGNAQGVMGHIVSAINTDDGTVRAGWPVNVSTAASFSPTIHNQRGALSLVNGILYVPYGGFVGDCGDYRGRVVAINTANPTMVGQWATAGQGEGIWHMGGLASDGNGVIAVTGNRMPRNATNMPHQDSEQVTRVTGMGTKADYFFPTDWQDKDSSDADFGSVNPMIINVPGATPSSMVAAFSKDGHLYLLDAAALRGTIGANMPGGQKLDFVMAASGMSIHSVPASYRTAMGTYVVISTTSGAMGCPAGSGGTGGRRVMGIRITPSPLAATVAWCAEMQTVTTGPIATTTDGTSDAIVWYTSNGQLRGVDGDTGAVIYSATNSCAGVAKWTSPIAVKGRIVVAGNGRLCAWGIPGALTP